MLNPYGFFVYRDMYAVKSTSLHDRAVHLYDSQSWLRFLRMFAPRYLLEGTHPYHRQNDEVLVRQNSRIIPVAELDSATCTFISAPVGLFREIQRHYITFRDHVWRSGVLGFRPMLDGQLSNDWIDFRCGYKRVHYVLAETDWLPRTQQTMLRAMSEPCEDHLVIDGDTFDEVTDVALTAFLAASERGDSGCTEVWMAWAVREGRETYAYMTVDQLIAAFAVNSVEADQRGATVLIPVQRADILRKKRNYYNRFLAKRLASPLCDAKQLILFQNIPLSDTGALGQALDAVQGLCSRASLARIYTAINSGGSCWS